MGAGGGEGEAHKMSGMEGGESWSKLCILGGRALILEGDMEVVYHLHGKTGRSTVWVSSAQNSGKKFRVNFAPESRLRFVQISSINYQKTTAKA